MIGQLGEDPGKPSLRINVVELRGFDQGVDGRRPAATGVGAAEGPIAPSDGDASEGALGRVV